jgi:hypothetical protein
MEGNDLGIAGETPSSRVERRVVDSGGEIYPDSPAVDPAVGGAQEYGGGGPGYMPVVGLGSGPVEILRPFMKENLEWSCFSTLMLSISR